MKNKRGILYGIVFGLVDASLMLPLEFDNKPLAMLGAFLQRFAIGFLIPLVSMKVSNVYRGIIVSLLISIPTAVITGSYLPILVMGTLGGGVIGYLDGKNKK